MVVRSSRWVVVPGTLCTAQVFDPLLQALGVDQSAVVMPDKPRVGDYAAPLGDLLRGGDILCGFSLGAIVLAHNLPAIARARAVVLLACNPKADPPANRAARKAVQQQIAAGEIATWLSAGWSRMSVDPSPRLRGQVAAMAHDTRHLIAVQTDLASTRPDARSALMASPLPMVCVTGADDQLTPPELMMPFADRAAPTVVTSLPGLGHFALLEDPHRVAQAIRTSLTTVLSFAPPKEGPLHDATPASRFSA